MARWEKTPAETLDFGFDWSKWLGSDAINSSTWTLEGGISSPSDTYTDKITTVWISGGTIGYVCGVKNVIVSTAGRTAERSRKIFIIPKKVA